MKVIRKTIMTSTVMLLTQYQCKNYYQEFQLPSFVKLKQFNANNPIEDRVAVSTVGNQGLAVSVFDGHGGDICAEYVSKNIQRCLNDAYLRHQNASLALPDKFVKVVEEAYDELESGFKAVFKDNITNPKYKGVGACALTAILLKDCAIFANSGDCQAAYLGVNGKQPTVKLTQRLNAGEASEQKRLREAFPNEDDIYQCYPGTNYCYVKGRLQPTRSFGDFYLKYPQYNFTRIQKFTGPYITHKPVITIHKYNNLFGKNLVVATDGLWDQLSEFEMHEMLAQSKMESPIDTIFVGAVQKILARNRISSFERLEKIQNRRRLHDDISVIVVDMPEFLKWQKTRH